MKGTSVFESEEFVATLLHQDEYRNHLNEVASLTTKQIRFVERKFGSMTGWQLVEIPMADCAGIAYDDQRPLFKIVLGLLFSAVTIATLCMLYIYWDELQPGTRVPVGALILALVGGLGWAFRSRRHRLSFSMKDGRTLVWKSGTGDYKYKAVSAGKVVEFARSASLLSNQR